jgi:integrase
MQIGDGKQYVQSNSIVSASNDQGNAILNNMGGRCQLNPTDGSCGQDHGDPRLLQLDSDFVFATQRGGTFTPDAIDRLIKRVGARAGFAFPMHAHMLRHACYALANAGHDTRRIQEWLGHKSIPHTTRYTQLSAPPFKDFWR